MSAKTDAQAAVVTARAAADTLVDPDVEMTIDEIERLVGDARTELADAILALEDEYGVEGQTATAALRALAVALQALGAGIIEAGGALTLWTVPAVLPVTLIAHRLYEDVERAEEIQRLNRTMDPNRVLAGTVLRVYPA